MAIVFRNQGIIDPRSITTFGVSAKETENPIGYFGTGMKYAIAILLREGHKITVWAGDERYDFSLEAEEIRGQSFNIVCMNDQKLGFTTELGKNWEIWQAYRELYCNTMDENGEVNKESLPIATSDDQTVVCVEGSKFERCFARHSDYFLTTEALMKSATVEIHPGTSNVVYYRGVRVGQLSKPSRFTYNLLDNVDLTEDRTMQSEFEAEWNITICIARCDNASIISDIMTAQGFFEDGLDYSSCSPSKEFVATCFKLEAHDDINMTAMEACRKDLGSLKDRAVPMVLDQIDTQRLESAKRFLLEIGHDVSQHDIVVTDSLGHSTLGMATEQTIFISPRAFSIGTKMLASTLLEEHIHLKFGLRDNSRKMQNHLFDMIMDLAERVTNTCLDDDVTEAA